MQSTLTRPAPTSRYTLRSNDKLVGEYLPDTYQIPQLRDLSDDQKPREKLQRLGPSSLSVPELVAALLGVGTTKEDVLKMAHRIVKEYGEKAITSETNPRRLAEALGIPVIKACQIIAALELGRRFFASNGGKSTYVRNARQAYQYLRAMGYSTKEQLRGLYLNSRYQVIHDEVISVGSLTANIVHPREVFRPAIEHGAVAVIVAHNHPSGSLSPTAEDCEVTRQLVHAGRLLGIDLLDHLVITERAFIRITEDIHV